MIRQQKFFYFTMTAPCPILQCLLLSLLVNLVVTGVCPDAKFSCPDETTCCLAADGSTVCCPMPSAVCCSDKIHCCPQNTKCVVSNGTCVQHDNVLRFFSHKNVPTSKESLAVKMSALDTEVSLDNQIIVNGLEHQDLPMKKLTFPEICEGAVTPLICRDGYKCCKLSSGFIGCCDKNTVLCGTGLHTCPQGFSCDVDRHLCVSSKLGMSLSMTDQKPRRPQPVDLKAGTQCDGKTTCVDTDTCCRSVGGGYGCCPLTKGECCNDGAHCCPNGTKCDLINRRCFSEDTQAGQPMIEHKSSDSSAHKDDNVISTSALTLIVKGELGDVVCPGGGFECPDGNTCCPLGSGAWGCCLHPKAVCCSDLVHCCPEGYTCDVEAGQCRQQTHIIPWTEKLLAQPRVVKDLQAVICPGGRYECPDGNTCCQLASGVWACCPQAKAVCCSDHIHCCPHGYKCDVSSGQCQKGTISLPWTEKQLALPRIVKGELSDVVCPGGGFECPDGNTCCPLASGAWGCCPHPLAVCCSDLVHCCPQGYTCDVAAGQCRMGAGIIPWTEKARNTTQLLSVGDIRCGDGSSCPDGYTCCQLQSGGYGCCPHPQAVCCSDGLHCCPSGYTCDLTAGQCVKAQTSFSQQKKEPVLMRLQAEDVPCGDGSECPDNNTCCPNLSGGYGCCPDPQATCCSDGLHCCPQGYTCDVSSGTCVKSGYAVPWQKKQHELHKPSVADVLCPDGQSACPDGNTCCQTSSGGWGCCPVVNATCCSDGQHCCPEGYTCDVSSGRCTKDQISLPWQEKQHAKSKLFAVPMVFTAARVDTLASQEDVKEKH